MSEFCQLCCWNDGLEIFDDTVYSLPPVDSFLYKLYIWTGYNHVINSNSINSCVVCYDCLIEKVYNCDVERKSMMLNELKIHLHMNNFGKQYNIPVEIMKKIQEYIS